ncbi:MAG: DUF5034 domain-containing protein [Cyclobacteriaceae bacterium]|nr:DUF5034 domain-containing protein [Cyclobacteriaceae bacterium HetDA_MAG_MS6]
MKRAFIVYFILEMFLIAACADLSDDCTGVQDAGGVPSVGNINARDVVYNSYNNIRLLELGDTLSFQDYAIWLEVEPKFVAKQLYNGSFGGQAMACDVVAQELSDRISRLSIFTQFQYNDTIPAGADMTDLFSFQALEEQTPLESNSLNDFFTRDFYLFLRPTVPPGLSKTAQFQILVEIDDGRSFTLTTNGVWLTN